MVLIIIYNWIGVHQLEQIIHEEKGRELRIEIFFIFPVANVIQQANPSRAVTPE